MSRRKIERIRSERARSSSESYNGNSELKPSHNTLRPVAKAQRPESTPTPLAQSNISENPLMKPAPLVSIMSSKLLIDPCVTINRHHGRNSNYFEPDPTRLIFSRVAAKDLKHNDRVNAVGITYDDTHFVR